MENLKYNRAKPSGGRMTIKKEAGRIAPDRPTARRNALHLAHVGGHPGVKGNLRQHRVLAGGCVDEVEMEPRQRLHGATRPVDVCRIVVSDEGDDVIDLRDVLVETPLVSHGVVVGPGLLSRPPILLDPVCPAVVAELVELRVARIIVGAFEDQKYGFEVPGEQLIHHELSLCPGSAGAVDHYGVERGNLHEPIAHERVDHVVGDESPVGNDLVDGGRESRVSCDAGLDEI